MSEAKTVGQSPVVERMQAQIQQWEQVNDRRAIFLACYALMTQNMLAAVQDRDFKAPTWVGSLLHRFAEYYFLALDAYENSSPAIPAVWQITFQAACNPQVAPLQHLLLGVNAHINYDLTLALVDMLHPEWEKLSTGRRLQRYQDHCHVNAIIAQTVDVVQDTVLERYSPGMDLLDRMLGPMDEWATVKLISHWRDQVWDQAVELLSAGSHSPERLTMLQKLEENAVSRARRFLRWGGDTD